MLYKLYLSVLLMLQNIHSLNHLVMQMYLSNNMYISCNTCISIS